jgi:hypothetical protein
MYTNSTPTALYLHLRRTINGSFTAASPAPNNYLVVASTSATPPTPLNGTVYSNGSTRNRRRFSDDNNTTFSATGLSPGTTYYVFFSYNFFCTEAHSYTQHEYIKTVCNYNYNTMSIVFLKQQVQQVTYSLKT